MSLPQLWVIVFVTIIIKKKNELLILKIFGKFNVCS